MVIVVFLFLGNPRHADPADRRAGVADRHLRGHAGAGLLLEHGLAAGPGPGDRHRGRRRHRRGRGGRGQPRGRAWPVAVEAAKRAMGQITAPILAITLVLLSVFVPVAFIPGISGQLYQQFAVAVAVSMVISAINALTLSPALCGCCCATMPARSAGRCATCWGRSTSPATATPPSSSAGACRRCLSSGRGGGPPPEWLAVQGRSRRLPAVGGPGRVLRRGAAARGPRSTGPPSWPSGSRRSSRHPRRRRHQHGRRLQHAGWPEQVEQRLLHRPPQAV